MYGTTILFWLSATDFFFIDCTLFGALNPTFNALYLHFAATVRKANLPYRQQLKDFGQYVAECLPKYIQRIQVTNHEELELLIHPEGVVPVASFLKDHHNAQYLNITDIAGVDVPTRENRFEVR